MRLLFISDIHGIKTNLLKIQIAFFKLKCDKLIVLGDILNNGFYTYDYDPEFVRLFLTSFEDKIIIIKGNCDREEDLKKLNATSTYIEKINTDQASLYITHGHIYNESNWKEENTILIQGHTHRSKIEEKANNLYINPGSISKPRGNTEASYLFFNEKEFIIYDINDNIISKKALKK